MRKGSGNAGWGLNPACHLHCVTVNRVITLCLSVLFCEMGTFSGLGGGLSSYL